MIRWLVLPPLVALVIVGARAAMDFADAHAFTIAVLGVGALM